MKKLNTKQCYQWRGIAMKCIINIGFKICYALTIGAVIVLPFHFISTVVLGGGGV